MRALVIMSLVLLSASPVMAMSTKEKVRMILWVKGIKENPRPNPHVYTWPEEIEKPLRKL